MRIYPILLLNFVMFVFINKYAMIIMLYKIIMNNNIYWNTGTLRAIRNIVDSSKIVNFYGYKFSSLGDLRWFFDENDEQQLRRTHNEVVACLESKIVKNKDELLALEETIEDFSSKADRQDIWIFQIISNWYYTIRIFIMDYQVKKIKNILQNLLSTYDIILAREVKSRMDDFLEQKKNFSNQIKPMEAWYRWEKLVLDNLKNLPPNYVIINDINVSLETTIYDKKTKTTISTVQIDHVIIWPNGIFCIETKNWLTKWNYYDPIAQNCRHCYALYVLLGRKFSIKNIIAVNEIKIFNKEWQSTIDKYAKILEYNKLVAYILHYKSPNIALSQEDIQNMKSSLLSVKLKWYF